MTDAMHWQGENKYMTARWIEMITGKAKPAEARTGDEIARDVIIGAGLVIKGGGMNGFDGAGGAADAGQEQL